jgi:hypothetical protein
MMTDAEKAELIIQLLDAAAFNGKQRKMVDELYQMMEDIRSGRLVLVPKQTP